MLGSRRELEVAAVTAIAVFGLGAGSAAAATAVDVSVEAGIAEVSLTRGTLVADVNADGWDDLLVGRHYDAPPRLYINNRNGSFTDRRADAFGAMTGSKDRHGCAAADVDGNGMIDVYCTKGGKKGREPNPNELWLQREGGVFKERANAYGVADKWGRGRFAAFLNANGDGRPDLLVLNEYPRHDRRNSRNRLFINRGGTRFRPAPGYGLNGRNGSGSLQVLDFDRDGRDDVFVCGNERTVLYLSSAGGRYRTARNLNALRPCEHAQLVRVNRDRRPDLVRVTAAGLKVHMLGRTGFRRRPWYALARRGGRDAAVGDSNGDGRTDIYLLRYGRRGRDAPDVMLVQRRGRGFRKVRIPQDARGVGESVEAVDYDRNGLTDFVVQNGHRAAPGPIRLIAFR